MTRNVTICRFLAPLVVGLCVVLGGHPLEAQAADKLLVFAASSLTEALTEVGEAYSITAEKAGQPKPVFSFAASSALARQIENGAPAALFVSADEEWMDYLAQRKLIAPSTRSSFLSNTLVMIAPADRPLKLDIVPGFALAHALGGGKLSLADPTGVPAGRYAKAALEYLGVWPAVEAKTVRADSVRSAMAFVERGEAVAGIVYGTDAALTQKVVVAGTFPAYSHAPISYPLAVIASHDTPATRAFRDFMLGEQARAIYRKYGFSVQ